jgi:two-component system KDP operon response regulator KdpE
VKDESQLLLISDDASQVAKLCDHLRNQDYELTCVANQVEGIQALCELQPVLVLLNASSSGPDELQICGRIRQVCDAPIVVMGSCADEASVVRALSSGADDYVVKPVRLGELAARIEAILRRRRDRRAVAPKAVVLVDDGLVIDSDHWYVERDGEPIELTSTEMRVLLNLVANAGHILTHQQILERVWGRSDAKKNRYVKLYIWKLRNKIEPDPQHPRYILTERGLGYRFQAL